MRTRTAVGRQLAPKRPLASFFGWVAAALLDALATLEGGEGILCDMATLGRGEEVLECLGCSDKNENTNKVISTDKLQ